MTTISARIVLLSMACIAVPDGVYAQRSLDGNRRLWADCQAKRNASPAFLALRHKIGSRASPDIAFSTDKATPEEARNLQILLRDYIAPCRQFSLEVARARLPSIVPVVEASQVKEDVNYQELIAGQVTWGQFLRNMKADDAALDAELLRHENAAQGERQIEPPRN